MKKYIVFIILIIVGVGLVYWFYRQKKIKSYLNIDHIDYENEIVGLTNLGEGFVFNQKELLNKTSRDKVAINGYIIRAHTPTPWQMRLTIAGKRGDISSKLIDFKNKTVN